MIEKTPLIPDRVRKIHGSFAFIEHRFLRDGFWASLVLFCKEHSIKFLNLRNRFFSLIGLTR